MGTTTIRVPADLRDRLAAAARKEDLSLAGLIDRLLQDAEERAFWAAVREAHSGLTEEDRKSYLHDQTLTDDLADNNDDAISARDDW